MRIREIDPRRAPDDLLLAIHGIEEACAYERPFRDPAVSLAYYRFFEGKRRRWVAEGDGLLGTGLLMIPSPNFVQVEILVRPESRRRGIGRALLDEVCAAARNEGVSSFFADHADEAGAAFARAVGAVDDQRDIASELRLREADLPEPSPPAGWRLRAWTGAAPEELLESYAHARAAIDDAPAPGTARFDPIDAAWVRRMEETAVARARESRVTVAINQANDVGSFTDLRVSPAPCPVATTDDTATIASARGLGLAYVVKLDALRRLRDERPDVEVVRTLNAEHNVAMRRVNTKLGFVPTVALTAAVLTL